MKDKKTTDDTPNFNLLLQHNENSNNSNSNTDLDFLALDNMDPYHEQLLVDYLDKNEQTLSTVTTQSQLAPVNVTPPCLTMTTTTIHNIQHNMLNALTVPFVPKCSSSTAMLPEIITLANKLYTCHEKSKILKVLNC